ncbi:MAG: alpha/beta fold hydrolase [Chromatiaceae bacterium]|jgi:hypothetical protein|nr:alpha/beta fold hydrolase [Chromatiaceae bacterium]
MCAQGIWQSSYMVAVYSSALSFGGSLGAAWHSLMRRPSLYRVLGLVLTLCQGSAMAAQAALEGAERSAPVECVALLHGLGRTHRSMADMAEALQAAGYATVSIDYPSREQPIEALADSAVPDSIERCEQLGADRIDFVTHSMGGILLRYYLARHRVALLGRVVMLSPPNRGSEVTDALRNDALYLWYNGPAGQQLGTDPASLPSRLGPVEFPLGVITGDRVAFYDLWLGRMIPGPNDGKVSVARAQVEGMTDFLVLPYGHTFIMDEPEVISQTLHFLRHGRFRHDAAAPQDPGSTVDDQHD